MLHTFPIPPAQPFLDCQKRPIYVSRLSLLPAGPGRGKKFSVRFKESDKETNAILSLSSPVSQGSSLPCYIFTDIFIAN